VSKEIPLNEAGVENAGWQRGSCFKGMGWHYFFNTDGTGKKLPMTAGKWKKGDLFPVVAMYDNDGAFNALFFASITSQYTDCGMMGCNSQNQWEPSVLNEFMMCKNFCGECGFDRDSADEDSSWATMHIYFNDHENLKCPASTTCFIPHWAGGLGCCDKDVLNSDDQSTEATVPASQVASNGKLFAVATGGLGLLVGAVVTFWVVRSKGGHAREVHVSEMSTTA